MASISFISLLSCSAFSRFGSESGNCASHLASDQLVAAAAVKSLAYLSRVCLSSPRYEASWGMPAADDEAEAEAEADDEEADADAEDEADGREAEERRA